MLTRKCQDASEVIVSELLDGNEYQEVGVSQLLDDDKMIVMIIR